MSEPYLTDERLMIQEVARDFTMNEVLPAANELDPVQGDIPMDLRRKMGELGYFGIRTPEEYGGLGLGVFDRYEVRVPRHGYRTARDHQDL